MESGTDSLDCIFTSKNICKLLHSGEQGAKTKDLFCSWKTKRSNSKEDQKQKVCSYPSEKEMLLPGT